MKMTSLSATSQVPPTPAPVAAAPVPVVVTSTALLPQSQFNYSDFVNPNITTQQLDSMFAVFTASATQVGLWAQISTFLKIVLFFVYVFTRDKLVSQQLLVAQQSYQQSQAQIAAAEIAASNLSGGSPISTNPNAVSPQHV